MIPPSSSYTFKLLFSSSPAWVNARLTEIWVGRDLKVHSSASFVSKAPDLSALSLRGLHALMFDLQCSHTAKAGLLLRSDAPGQCLIPSALASPVNPLLGSEFAGCWEMMEAMEVSLVQGSGSLGVITCPAPPLCLSVHL